LSQLARRVRYEMAEGFRDQVWDLDLPGEVDQILKLLSEKLSEISGVTLAEAKTAILERCLVNHLRDLKKSR
jgi:hypothetical protein